MMDTKIYLCDSCIHNKVCSITYQIKDLDSNVRKMNLSKALIVETKCMHYISIVKEMEEYPITML